MVSSDGLFSDSSAKMYIYLMYLLSIYVGKANVAKY